jgi:hypothetical protein
MGDTPADQSAGPITVNQMNHMMGQMFQQFARQQEQTIQQQVQAAVETAVQHVQHHMFTSPPSAAAAAASTASPNPSPSSGLARANPIVPLVSLPPKVKISAPSNFTGTRVVNVNSWIFERNQYLVLCGVTADDQRVAVATSYLKEAAFSWWENRCRQPNPPTQNWLTFADSLKERFQPLLLPEPLVPNFVTFAKALCQSTTTVPNSTALFN